MNTEPTVPASAGRTTRRALLRRLAMTPALAIMPAAAVATAAPDPIFAAIEAHKIAGSAYEAVLGAHRTDAIVDPILDDLNGAEIEMLEMVPTTLAGLLAYLEHCEFRGPPDFGILGKHPELNGWALNGDWMDIAFPTIIEAVRNLVAAA